MSKNTSLWIVIICCATIDAIILVAMFTGNWH